MNKKSMTRILAMLLVVAIMAGFAVIPASAAGISEATVNMDRTCRVELYKIDFTNAAKDGIWTQDSFVSTGQYNEDLTKKLILNATRKGASGVESSLENGDTANGYAIKGVEFTYLKVADLYQFTESTNDGTTYSHVEYLYKFDKNLAASLLSAIGLAGGKDSYENANKLPENEGYWLYRSDVLNAALAAALAANPTTVKNALEAYVKGNGGTAMALTDSNGYTYKDGLPVGLYVFVETKVPEMVTSSVNPFFLSLPSVNVDGGFKENGYKDIANGGHSWLYNVTLYPKNETGIVTLTKEVREAKKDTATHNGSTTDINVGYSDNATASTGDRVEFQILSTLPTITSTATNISVYQFKDLLSRGLTYDTTVPVKYEWFKNDTCLPADLVATWTEGDGKFTAVREPQADGTTLLTLNMTETGLAEINAANTADTNNNVHGNAADGEHLYTGYSNYTLRITYACTLNSNESMVYGDAGNPNTVVLTWKRSSSEYLDTLVDDAHVYSYAINLSKYFSDKEDQKAEEEGLYKHVLFKARNSSDGYYVQAKLNEAEGIWYVIGHTTKEAEATAIYPVTRNLSADNKVYGQIILKGVEDDEYILTEIETANGYTLLKENIVVDINTKIDTTRPCQVYANETKLGVIQNDPRYNFDGGLNLKLANIPQTQLAHNYLTASAIVDGNAVVMLNDDMDTASTNAMAPLAVVNTHAFDLPQTGETTTKWMPIVGGSLMGVAVLAFFVLFAMPKRKEEDLI